jgi:hypothetical protein
MRRKMTVSKVARNSIDSSKKGLCNNGYIDIEYIDIDMMMRKHFLIPPTYQIILSD